MTTTMTENETKVPVTDGLPVKETNPMTMTENETKVTTIMTENVIDLAAIVHVEAIYGQALLDEVAAVTELLATMRDELRAFMVRTTGCVRACTAAEDRVLAGTPHGIVDQMSLVLAQLSGVEALGDLLLQVGLHEAIFEAGEPGANPVDGQFVPGTFGQ